MDRHASYPVCSSVLCGQQAAQATEVKIIVGFPLKPLRCRNPPLPSLTTVVQRRTRMRIMLCTLVHELSSQAATKARSDPIKLPEGKCENTACTTTLSTLTLPNSMQMGYSLVRSLRGRGKHFRACASFIPHCSCPATLREAAPALLYFYEKM